MDSSSPVHLELGSSIPQDSKYATLSHCWGEYKPVQLLSSNIVSFFDYIDYTTLSKTFQDAITTVRVLGIQYIWIDSLCIIQDSTEDWSKESLSMKSVYYFSYLNIAATAAYDGREGLFFPHTPHHDEDMQAAFTVHSNHFRVIDPNYWHNTLERLPLFSRAWIYQERIITPRTLHFAQNSIAWDCGGGCRLSETFPVQTIDVEGARPLKDLAERLYVGCSNEIARAVLYKSWTHHVKEYTKCQLTFPTDKLIGLAGIARQIEVPVCVVDNFHGYFAGLWEGDMLNQLLWYVHNGSKRLGEEDNVYIAPSWSWASSHPNAVNFHSDDVPQGDYTHTSRDLATVVTIDRNSSEEFGVQNPGGFIILQTRICEASLIYNTDEARCGCCSPEHFNRFSTFFPGTTFADEPSNARFRPDMSFEDKECGFKVKNLYCIPLVEDVFEVQGGKFWTWATGLVVVRDEVEEGVFRRWGSWKCSFENVKGGLGVLESGFERFDCGEGLAWAGEVSEGGNEEARTYHVKII